MKLELVGSLAWIIVGSIFFWGSIRLGLGSASEPGPGFFPFLMSVCLISLSFVNLISYAKKVLKVNYAGIMRFWPEKDGTKRIIITVISLFTFTIILDYIGFTLTVFIFLFVLLRFVESRKWFTVFFVAGISTCLSYVIFQLWLKANLPLGPWGF